MKTFKAIPPNTVPEKTVCVVFEVPDSPEWLSALWWVMALYSYWFSWKKTADKRGKRIADRWFKMLNDARSRYASGVDCKSLDAVDLGVEFEVDCMTNFRVNPDNNCQLQTWCIDHWETFWDISACVAVNARQAVNGTPVPAGECREWDVPLHAWDKWLLPVSVSTGDTIEITLAEGATNDGSLLIWACPSGEDFVLGACSGAITGMGGDPLPSVNHQRLIVSIDGTFYDAYNQLVSVVAGVTDAQVFFQINDDPLAGNAGSLSFHVKVCRPSVSYILTPIWGTVPSSVVPGQTFVATSQLNGAFYQMTFSIAPCAAVLNLLSLTGWTPYAVGGASVWGYNDCAGGGHGGTYPGSSPVPVPQTVDAQNFAIFSATPFSAAFRID